MGEVHIGESEQPDTSGRSCSPCNADEKKRQLRHRSRGLLLIGLFKLSKALFFFVLGLATLHLIHHNLGDLTMKVASKLHINPDGRQGRFVDMLEDRADLVSGHQLRQMGDLSILYSLIALIEGYGLMRERVWAEYLTLTLTTGALPWEIFELARHATWSRWALLGINLLVMAYLLWLLRKNRNAEACASSAHLA